MLSIIIKDDSEFKEMITEITSGKSRYYDEMQINSANNIAIRFGWLK